MKISDETKVGVLAAFGIVILIMGYSFLKGNDLFSKKKFYYARYSKINGLSQADPVTLNGFRVGKVAHLDLLEYPYSMVIAKLVMERDVRLPKNTTARLISSDLLGEKAIELYLGDSEEFAMEGDTLEGDVELSLQEGVSEQLLPVKKKVESLFSSIDSVIVVVQTILSGGQIESAISELELAMTKFAHLAVTVDNVVVRESDRISSLLANVDSFMGNLASNSDNIDKTLENLAVLTDSLNKANLVELIANLNNTFKELAVTLESVNQGDGTFGKLVHDPELYNNLTKLTEDLDLLLLDVQENPKKYVQFSLFGGGSKSKSSKKDTEE